MDVYDHAFHDCVAIDDRIKKISDRLGLRCSRYVDHEAFYQTVAAEAGIQPWELDRALYWYNDRALAALGQPS
jgi:hypothetical protein